MIKVLIVDDSAVVRKVLTDQLGRARGLQVIGAARDPIFAMRQMQEHWPDVIVLDIEMPRMDGITFLEKLMRERPTPVVICSTLTGEGAELTMRAMAAGAVDVITKPTAGLKGFLEDARTMMIDAVRAAGQSKPGRMRAAAPPIAPSPKLDADAILPSRLRTVTQTTDRVVAIGTSTGGTHALEAVLTRLPPTAPGIVVVQHMPAQFTSAFAARLDRACAVRVKEAETNDRVNTGQVLIAPGSSHMLLRRCGAQYRVELREGPLVSRHRPSVDVLFRSVAHAAGPNALGIIMTGMGADGARGLREMHDAGAYTVAQDEATCVVYGMPKEAVKLGAVDREAPLDGIPAIIMSQAASEPPAARRRPASR